MKKEQFIYQLLLSDFLIAAFCIGSWKQLLNEEMNEQFKWMNEEMDEENQ